MVIVLNKSKNEKQIDSYTQLKSSIGVLLKIHFRIFSAKKKTHVSFTVTMFNGGKCMPSLNG